MKSKGAAKRKKTYIRSLLKNFKQKFKHDQSSYLRQKTKSILKTRTNIANKIANLLHIHIGRANVFFIGTWRFHQNPTKTVHILADLFIYFLFCRRSSTVKESLLAISYKEMQSSSDMQLVNHISVSLSDYLALV